MLDFFRSKAKSTVIQVIILVIVLVFIFWGVGTRQHGGGPNAITTVNGEDVSIQKYQRAYEQIVDRYQKKFGGALPPELLKTANIKQQAIDQLINQTLMRQAAFEAGIRVGSGEVRKVIEKMEAFQENGAFSMDRYKKMLTGSRMTVADFEDGVQNDLLQDKIFGSLSRLVRVSDSELRDWFAYGNDQIRLDYVVFKADDFRSKVVVTDEKLTAFMGQHKETYLTEAQIRLKYLAFPRKAPEAGGDPDLPFRRATEAYEGIIQAGSLEKYAAAKAVKVSETGFFRRLAPSPELAGQEELLKGLFALKKGELSSLLETKDGFAVFFLEDRLEPQTPPLAEVRSRVEKDFISAEARLQARQAATALLAKAKQAGSLAVEPGRVETSGLFSRSRVAGSGLPEAVAAQGLKLGSASPYPKEVSENNGVFYVLRFKGLQAAGEEAFAAQKEAIRKVLIENKQNRMMEAWLADLRSKAKISTNRDILGGN